MLRHQHILQIDVMVQIMFFGEIQKTYFSYARTNPDPNDTQNKKIL